MCSRSEAQAIINELRDSLSALFPRQHFDIILFGSHARDEATEDSDINVMFLVDVPREIIAKKKLVDRRGRRGAPFDARRRRIPHR